MVYLARSSRDVNREAWGRFAFGPKSRFFSQKASEVPAGGSGDAAWSLGMWMGRVPAESSGSDSRARASGPDHSSFNPRTRAG